MNRGKGLKKYIIGFGMVMALGLISGLSYAAILQSYYVQDVGKIIGRLYREDPTKENEWMLMLKDASAEDGERGKALLRRYGYGEYGLKSTGVRAILGMSSVSMLTLAAIALVWFLKYQKKNKRRIKELTQYLKTINKGEVLTLIGKKEDDYALLEDEIYKTVGTLYQSEQVTIKEKEALKDNLADIAHQLKTPLTAITIMTELLKDSIEDRDEKLYMHHIQKQVQRLEYLVRTLLILSKLDAHAVQFENKQVDVYILCLRVMENMEALFEERRQRLVITSKQGGNEENQVVYKGDMKWSIEALMNLVKNCSEHTPNGGKIILSYNQNPLYTEILVEDEGTGFSKEDIPYLFKRFYKGKNAHKESVGIGLALAQTIIEKQNGLIDAENRIEGGARFRIKIYSR